MKIKICNGAEVAYFAKNEVPESAEYLLIDSDNSGSIWIKQPNKNFGRINLTYGESPYFQRIRDEIDQVLEKRKHANWHGRLTGCLFVKNGRVLVIATQNPDLHQFKNSSDEYCIREKMKIAGTWKTGDSYSICPGCNYPNHSEAQAIHKAKAEGISLAGSTCYLYNHWWSCEQCTDKMLEAGVKNVVLSKVWTKQFLQYPSV